MGKGQEAIDFLHETKFDLLEKLSYIEDKKDRKFLFDYLIESKKFEDDFFRRIIEENEITDSKQKNIYRGIYAQTLLLIHYLFVSGEKFAHYTKKAVAQKLLFDDNAKFRLSMSTLSNDTKEGKTLFDYLGMQSEYERKELIESNNNSVENNYRAFIGCFSFNTDCLNQFRLYGKDGEKEGTGVSLVFYNDSFNSTRTTPTSSTNKYNSLLYRCMYLNSETGRVVSIGHQEEYMRTMDDSDKNYLENTFDG